MGKARVRAVVQGNRLTLLARADDTWIIAKTASELERMVSDLRAVAFRRAGLGMMIPNYTWTRVQRQDQDEPSLRVTPEQRIWRA